MNSDSLNESMESESVYSDAQTFVECNPSHEAQLKDVSAQQQDATGTMLSYEVLNESEDDAEGAVDAFDPALCQPEGFERYDEETGTMLSYEVLNESEDDAEG